MGETINVEAVPIQGVGIQSGGTMSQPIQLPVKLLPVQYVAFGFRVICADGIHRGGHSVFLRPE